MLYIRNGDKIWYLNEHQLGFLLYMVIIIGWYLMQLNARRKELNCKNKKNKKSSTSKLRKQIHLKVSKIRSTVNKKRIKWLKKRRQKIDSKIEKLNIANSFLLEKQIEIVSSLRGVILQKQIIKDIL